MLLLYRGGGAVLDRKVELEKELEKRAGFASEHTEE